MSDNMNVLLMGAGYMGKEYTKVLQSFGITPLVICRKETSANKFESETGIRPYIGGLEAFFKGNKKLPSSAIVAVNSDQEAKTIETLIRNGVKEILAEKPGGMNRIEIQNLADLADKYGSDIYIGYNRRFYSSVEKAMEIVQSDGGVSSFSFEFTEWGFKIEPTPHPLATKQEWLLLNSSHVIDLAFFLGGNPKEISSYRAGSLSWHSRASQYTGAGITETGALFSYQANWDAPGRWAVEVLTNKHRLYLKPLEKLYIQNKGSVTVEEVPIDDKLDIDFKPGLYKQTKAFLSREKDPRLLTIEEQVNHMRIYEKIEGLA